MKKKSFRVAGFFCALAAALTVNTAAAAIVTVSNVNLSIPDNGIGLYLNFIDGTTFTGPGTFPSLGGPGANYDLNIYGGTTSWTFFSPGTSGQSSPTVPTTSKGYVSASATGAVVALGPGTLIDGTSIFNTGSPSGNIVATGTQYYIGLRFRNEGADLTVATDDTIQFGWALISLPDPALTQNGTLISYAYESTPGVGITTPAVPEPGTLALAGMAVAGLAMVVRRRRA